ncbi:MAG: hypothetical protein BWX61_00795 [Bacteroidetes bacterium ADurb.Bin035]|nr:MAG: hypothetical protein BWX61_00795 [Bacteroidetes bacterium ADurb.Bin035]
MIYEGNPSRYNAKINAKNISIVPISFCKNIKSMGIAITIKTFLIVLLIFVLASGSLHIFEINRAVVYLANSDGCSLMPLLMSNQALLPPTMAPITKTKNNKTNITP